ncbi:hypothetical protein M1L60_43155, partial [Actinoplanes sp. TRM 88003]
MAVAQIEPEKVGIRVAISRLAWWIGAASASRPIRFPFRPATWTIAVEPVADRPTGQSELAANVAEGHTLGAQLDSSLAEVRRGPIQAVEAFASTSSANISEGFFQSKIL